MRYLTKKTYVLKEEGEGSWAISYGDMITLLLSFFVVFFTNDLTKEKVNSLNSYMAFSMQELEQIPGELFAKVNKSSLAIGEDQLAGLDVSVQKINNRLIISFGKFSFFKSGQTEVNAQGIEVLKKFVEKFLPFAGAYSLSIKGFTDKKKVSFINGRRYKDNLELSALRSISAMRAMQKSGIPLKKMEIAGAGELNLIKELIPGLSTLPDEKKNDYSRTIMIVISPESESWL